MEFERLVRRAEALEQENGQLKEMIINSKIHDLQSSNTNYLMQKFQIDFEEKGNLMDHYKVVFKQAFENAQNPEISDKSGFYDIMNNSIDKMINIGEEQLKLIEEAFHEIEKNNFIGDFIHQYIHNLNIYLSDFNFIQLGALGHIFANITILFLLSNILSAYFGDSMINYFKLEIRFPKLAKFIQLRRKYMRYYVLMSILIITLLIFYVIFVDLSVFIEASKY